MIRSFLIVFLTSTLPFYGGVAAAQATRDSLPTTYELMINGETYVVESNRLVKLDSKQKPGTSYQVAVRVAPTQTVRLNTLRFSYDMPARLSDDQGAEQRTAVVRHELGMNLTITDQGEPLPASEHDKAVATLVKGATEWCQRRLATAIQPEKPFEEAFEGCAARGVKIRYKTRLGEARTSTIYLLTGQKFGATFHADCADEAEEECQPIVKKTINSIRALP